ncbi:hypothetical protein CHCC20331_4446 [Bacillus paralicheniformis]|nr:hypothetical protein CHCC20331_4446 [Bacillus paralicheniformis]
MRVSKKWTKHHIAFQFRVRYDDLNILAKVDSLRKSRRKGR